MKNYKVSQEYTNIRDYLNNRMKSDEYEIDGIHIYKKHRVLFFTFNEVVGDFYGLIYSPGNQYKISSYDKKILEYMEVLCAEYEKMTDGYCSFVYELKKFTEIK